MPRETDTRSRTAAAAAELEQQGIRPSSRKVRNILGTGSLSTIRSELVKLGYAEEESSPGKADSPEADPSAEPPALPLAAPDPRVADALEAVLAELRLLREELTATRANAEVQLNRAYERYESVQKHALMQVEAARQEVSVMREKMANMSVDAQVREDALRGMNQKLRDENQRLQGQLEAFLEQKTHS